MLQRSLIVAIGLFGATQAHAGMPFLTLTEIAEMRIEALGFFIALFFVVALVIQLLWTSARREFPQLPRASYGTSLAFVFTLALLFQVVLAMISGARELMTPGAWEKSGALYNVRSETRVVDVTLDERHNAIQKLGAALRDHAARHDGRFLAHDIDNSIDASLWQVRPSLRFIYVPGATLTGPPVIVVYEPAQAGQKRLVFKNNGETTTVSESELDALLRGKR